MTDMRYIVAGLAGIAGVLGTTILLTRHGEAKPLGREYVYDVTLNFSGCKQWQYIEPKLYNLTLNRGDSIKLNLIITGDGPLDVVEHRFYHLCNAVQGLATGRFFCYVDGHPALPTIGIVDAPVPLYFAAPRCPAYGVIETAIWDTDDTRKTGFTEYKYVYEGNTPVSFRTIELYVTRGG